MRLVELGQPRIERLAGGREDLTGNEGQLR